MEGANRQRKGRTEAKDGDTKEMIFPEREDKSLPDKGISWDFMLEFRA
jgi:hypothetical protein